MNPEKLIVGLKRALKEKQTGVIYQTPVSVPVITETIKALIEVEKLQNWIKISSGLKCPNCDDSGAYCIEVTRQVDACCGNFSEEGNCCEDYIATPVKDQQLEPCQFCYECPDSIFNREQHQNR